MGIGASGVGAARDSHRTKRAMLKIRIVLATLDGLALRTIQQEKICRLFHLKMLFHNDGWPLLCLANLPVLLTLSSGLCCPDPVGKNNGK